MLYIALIALVAGVLGACTTNGFEAGPQVSGPQVSFLPTNLTSIDLTGAAEENTQRFTLTRVETEEELAVYILVGGLSKDDQAIFTVPEFVVFKAGQASAELAVTIDYDKLADDKVYELEFLIDDEAVITPYGCASWKVSFAKNPWELVKDSKGNNAKAKFRGMDLFTGGWNYDPSLEIDVNIYEHKSMKGYYKVESPWALSFALTYGFNTVAEAEAAGLGNTNADFFIDASNPSQVIFEEQSAGIDVGYGDMFIQSGYPNYFPAAAGSGTLENGVITFPVKGCVLSVPGIDALVYGNNNGMFRIIMPGVEIADYSLAVVYDGMDVAADNVTTTAKFKFTYGADVAGIKYMLVNGNQEEQAAAVIATLLAGEDENILAVENFEQGKGEANVRVGLQSGIYTIVAAPINKNGTLESKTAAVYSFYFKGMGTTESHPCEIRVEGTKFSEVYPDYAMEYPDYSALAYFIYGTQIKTAFTHVVETALLETLSAEYASLKEYILAEGEDCGEYVPYINTEEGLDWYALDLKESTEYTILVYAENEYGEGAVATTTYTTDAKPTYNGELAIGQYKMSCIVEMQNGPTPFENVFTVTPNGDSTTEYFVSDLGFADGNKYKWYATYDSANSTLTLDGRMVGYETYGNIFGAGYGKVNISGVGTCSYGIFSVNSEESQYNDPIVFGVDPTTKQITSLNVGYIECAVFYSNQYLGALSVFEGAGTTIEPYNLTSTASTQSVSLVESPFRTINKSLAPISSLSRNRLERAAGRKSAPAISSVKLTLVENYTPAKSYGVAFKANPAVIAR